MAFDPQIRLLAGSRVLAPLLNRSGFGFEPQGATPGSHRAVGRFVAGDRALELEYQWGLAAVRYRIGEFVLSHADFMSLLGVDDCSAYLASFSLAGDDGDRFLALRDDLLRYAGNFLEGDGQQIIELAQQQRLAATT